MIVTHHHCRRGDSTSFPFLCRQRLLNVFQIATRRRLRQPRGPRNTSRLQTPDWVRVCGAIPTGIKQGPSSSSPRRPPSSSGRRDVRSINVNMYFYSASEERTTHHTWRHRPDDRPDVHSERLSLHGQRLHLAKELQRLCLRAYSNLQKIQ